MRPDRTMRGKVLATCQQCGAKFLHWPSQQPRFCSRLCADAARVVPIDQRFWMRVKKTATCWLWMAGTSKRGYGMLARGAHASGMVYTHQFSYELHIGTIPAGLYVLHTCDNRRCVNPAHLLLGTLQDNHRDMMQKGRNARGESHGHTTLTEEQVRAIRARYAAGGISQRQLAREYRVSPDTLSSIVRRKLWAHVE